MTPTSRTPPPGGPRGDHELARFLGLQWASATEVALEVRPELVNDVGRLLGPVVLALMDYVMSAAVWDELAADEVTATTSIAVNMIGSATSGRVTCHAVVDRRTRRSATCSARLVDDAGTVIATGQALFAVLPSSTAQP